MARGRNGIALAALLAVGQLPPATAPGFAVASIKPSTSRDAAMRINWPRGRFSATNVTMKQLVGAAYTLQSFRIAGGPGWFAADRFNVEATVGADTALGPARGMPEALRLMVQRLLVDRFMFAAHWEKKPQTVYALVRTKPGGPLGPNLRTSDADCAALLDAVRRGGPLPANGLCRNQQAPGKLTAGGFLMAQLADSLESVLQEVVVDRTGLAGRFDVNLEWSIDPAADAGPSIFTAVQEQLGLKLEATKVPFEVLVVDRLEKPSPD